MAANGISTLPSKAARQLAKLILAQSNRIASGRRSKYNVGFLPAPYFGNTSVPANGNTGQPPIVGRPWF
jgi:hypothetical protein